MVWFPLNGVSIWSVILNKCNRALLYLTLALMVLSKAVYAHYPHDAHEFITLSPFFSADGTVFVSQKQGASIRPHVALVSRNKGFTWEFNPAGMDNTSKFTSAAVSPLYDIDSTVFMTTANEGVYRSVDGGTTWATVNQGLQTKRIRSSLAVLDNIGLVNIFISGAGGGIYRTNDSGSTWTTVLAEDVIATALAVSPSFAVDGTILAGEPTGLMHISTDGGGSFAQINDLTGIGYITKIIFSPDYSASGIIYVATTAGLGVGAEDSVGQR